MNRKLVLAAVIVLASISQGTADNTPVREARIGDQLKTLMGPPVTRVDLDCGENQKNCMDAARAKGKGWSCFYWPQRRMWCLKPPS